MNKIHVVYLVCGLLGISACSQSTDKPEEPYVDVIFFGYEQYCPGCVPQDSSNGEITGLEIMVSIQHEESAHGVSNHWMMRAFHEIEQLPLDTCTEIPVNESDNPELDSLNAGIISIDAEPKGSEPFTIEWEDLIEDYPSIAIVGGYFVSEFHNIENFSISGTGSTDISEFESAFPRQEPVTLLTPSTDSNGITPSIPHDEPLDVTWNGGDDDSLSIWLYPRWSWVGGPLPVIGCHVRNDGRFTIPEEAIELVGWGNKTTLTVMDLQHRNLGMQEIPDASVAAASTSTQIVHYDPDATPPDEDPTGVMEEGYVGNPCLEDSECGGGQCFLDDVFTLFNTYGYCSIANCANDDDCPSDGNCFINTNIPSIPYTSFCAQICVEDGDCRVDDGYICREDSCIPGVW